MNIIFGASGFAKEVDWLIEDIYLIDGVDYRIDFFVTEDCDALVGSTINSHKVISESNYFQNYAQADTLNLFIAVGNPSIKEKIVKKIKANNSKSCFPNLIHPNLSYDKRSGKVLVGEGNILCSKSVLTTDIVIGNFVHVNLDCTVGHDSVICDYVTLSPGVHVSGKVRIGERAFVGTGAVLLEKIKICDNAVVGAGAVVTKDLTLPGTYVGMPAQKIR